ncbi:hypothetical protein Taro_054188 [Colocasia esculenta]|uniref:Uncharacterized protein n=1 Tax=Colocasia esculenta TaxID=4460 RepID=A0A843XN21_COLES|nr:hypothetical protein [Colocasia esculenta]
MRRHDGLENATCRAVAFSGPNGNPALGHKPTRQPGHGNTHGDTNAVTTYKAIALKMRRAGPPRQGLSHDGKAHRDKNLVAMGNRVTM